MLSGVKFIKGAKNNLVRVKFITVEGQILKRHRQKLFYYKQV